MAEPKKILVVDDEADMLTVLKGRLEGEKFHVVSASSGEAALSQFNKQKPDAVLLDIMMPGVDGLEVLQKIRSKDKNIPVFIMTAYSNEERFKKANELNASGFILKNQDVKHWIPQIHDAINLAEKYKK